jgi:hypothetical protein
MYANFTDRYRKREFVAHTYKSSVLRTYITPILPFPEIISVDI